MSRSLFDQQVTFIYTDDLEATAEFYSSAIGLQQVMDQGACRIFRVSETGFFGVCKCLNRRVEPEGVCITFVTEDVDAWHERLRERDVLVDGPPRFSDEFMVYGFLAFDPNGYRLEVQDFRSPDWRKEAAHTSRPKN